MDVVHFLANSIKDAECLNLDSNPWELPPASVVVKGRDSMQSYYSAWETMTDLQLDKALKVVFVGTAGAGKTRYSNPCCIEYPFWLDVEMN